MTANELAERTPCRVNPGEFAFAVGTAGSATLVLQTVLPALLTAPAASKLVLEGGTHNPMAPPFDFLQKSFLPLINRMGPTVSAELERPGFYPAGGGRFNVSITPAARLLPLEMLERGAILSIRTRAVVANLWRSIAVREANLVGRLLSLSDDSLIVEEIHGAPGPGNAVTVEIETEHHTEVFTGFGEVNVRAEGVATRVAQEARAYAYIRALFANSREKKTSSNDADRLRKYLSRFGITWDLINRRKAFVVDRKY
jgi:RNA 3'-terminal phosphate cyclase (ATP)